MVSLNRAAKGGECGANGEWYEGGKFIARTERPKSHGSRSKKPRRAQVEINTWIDGREGFMPIFPMLAGIEIFNRAANTFTLNPDLRGEFYASAEAVDRRCGLIENYNAGKRWRAIESGVFE